MMEADTSRAVRLIGSVGSSAAAVRRARRRWTLAEKLAIVEAAKTSGDPVSVVARRHGMNANHLFNWLQRDRDGTLDRSALYVESGGPLSFVEVARVEAAAAPALEIDLPCGARVKVAAGANAAMLGPILLAVKGAS